MKKLIFAILAILVFVTPALAIDKTIVATWNANTESDMAGYTGYQYSSSTDTTVDTTWTVAHPTTTKSMVLSVPDNGTATLCLELDAFDLAGNHSAKTSRVCVTATGNDTLPPAIPTNLKATVQ